ncbi:MAG: nucleoside-diphosphate sugar epimerase/dehydratase [Campylobacterota bacterium]|nr:nucleoside-diphosphate sugar epimerase/dehydratase [Campylobacterota bacterium]
MFKPTAFKRTLFFLIFDIFISSLTLILAYNLRFNFEIPAHFMNNFLVVFLVLTSFKVAALSYFNIYKIAWRFFSLKNAKTLLVAHIVAYSAFVALYYINSELFNPFPRSVILIDLFLSILFIGFTRLIKRIIIEENSDTNLKKSMIIGVSQHAQSILKDKNEFYVDAIVDTDATVIGSYISNIRVDGFDAIEKIVKSKNIETVVITKELEKDELSTLSSRLTKLGVKEILRYSLENNRDKFVHLSVEDLLARHPKDLDKKKIETFLKSKVVLVTGAGGSIGSEICRQCEAFGVKRVVLLDNSEYNLYKITEEIQKIDSVSVMRNVIDKQSMDEMFQKYKPEIVIHAAAYKHVPLVEMNINEGIINNILGTKNVIDLSIAHGVEKFVMISTDKAVRPTNVMGATKRICELYAQNVNAKATEIVSVRFGNVLGSSGSVIPKFKSQIENGENITVTHPDITRYFMLIPEACELVLQAGAIGKGGEIFILDMGEPIKIVDLANKMIELSGKNGIGIDFIGLRAGEKLYEELLIDESDTKTDYESITVAHPTEYGIEDLNADIEELVMCEKKLDKLKEIVPEFNHQKNIKNYDNL